MNDSHTITEIWNAYREHRPIRVPLLLGANPRVWIGDPSLNTGNISFEDAATDPEMHVQTQLQHQLYRRTVLNQFCDEPTGIPETWEIRYDVYNVYEAAYFGAEIEYAPGQVPDTIPPFADEDRKEEVFEIDITRPAENPFIKQSLSFWNEMERICRDLTFEGRPVRLLPWADLWTDGPVTVGCNLRGTDFLLDLIEDPEYADRLMNRIVDLAINRRRMLIEYWGEKRLAPISNWMADDSIAMLSTEMYQERILPLHRRYYQSMNPEHRPYGMHLCGDSTRHFKLIADELDVTCFDTGFPVDHGGLRRELGPDIELWGGPQISLLSNGTSGDVYQRTREILQSGVMDGGRFILREANNLPPSCPLDNLQAMYEACLEFGRYPVSTSA